jgi:predicted RNA-binding Zn-ribbon protein involved in translation (DUF1610 family)
MNKTDAQLRCPKCGSVDIANIVYAPSNITDELLSQIQAKKTVLRTEKRTDTAPRYYCNYCGYEW